jgi:Putative peptidoglycan binding domain
VPRRRKTVPLYWRAANAGGALLLGLWDRATERPIDFVAVAVAAALSAVIVVNALYLQSGSRAAPYVAALPAASGSAAGATNVALRPLQSSAQVTGTTTLKPSEQVIAMRPVASAATAPQPVSVRRDDPIAELIAPQPSAHITSVQRALSEYGYGQIKPSGILDEPTVAAIEKFEREHKMPVTGRVSERLVSQLAALVGHSLN